jgi:Fic family protein
MNVDLSSYVENPFGRLKRVPGPAGYHFFSPAPLPRSLPIEPATTRSLSAADRALGRLAGTGRLLPNPHLLVQPYLTTEALASSRIEGTQASLSDVFEAAAEDATSSDQDVREVQNYIAAFELGHRRLADLPLSLRLVREIHARLLQDVRGEEKGPGEFRTSQNRIGRPGCTLEQADFVPPRHDPEMLDALADWERYLNDPEHEVPPLVVCALLHYQFETIHPFLDGNGRLGRLVIVLYLLATGELPEPLLYLSPYFESDREAYYEHLQAVRERGEMQRWLRYFLDGVTLQANDAVLRAERLLDLQARYRSELVDDRSRASEVVELLFQNPFITTNRVMKALGVTNAGANNLLHRLEGRSWLRQARVAGRGGRITWFAPEVMAAIAEPIAADGVTRRNSRPGERSPRG